ncbi:MAG TPA: glycosyltransferase family 39 protein, partial [Candidatus Binataceae bacterium]|nr:glycosyltransferase family 39 protein [Candidatus Binataceae bacterium]
MQSEVEVKSNPQTESPGERVARRVMLAIIAISLTSGIAFRTIALDRVPPGLHADEAVEGYDAYCLLKTGRDHHGNFLPVVAMQSFNDYRKPLFVYSLVPVVATLGLTPRAVRMGAALWGAIDLIAMTAIGGLSMGLPGAAAAAMLGAVMPWHLSLSRFGIETTCASAMVDLAMLCFLGWRRKKGAWLLASAVFFGSSLYAYSVTGLFVPMMSAFLGVMYWKELRGQPRQTLAAAAIVIAFAVPQACAFVAKPATAGRFEQLSLFSDSSTCLGCSSDGAQISLSSGQHLINFAANWASHFTPSFLFTTGDRGDHWTLCHLPGFGQLLPI